MARPLALMIVFAITLTALLGLPGVDAHADVTGSFGAQLDYRPQTAATELSPLLFDLQFDASITVVTSGLSTTVHAHTGMTGVEDAIVDFDTTIGSLDVVSTIAFAQPFGIQTIGGQRIPTCLPSQTGGNCELHFVTHRLKASLPLAGFTADVLTIVDDTNFPQPGLTVQPDDTYGSRDQAFAFGLITNLQGPLEGGPTVELLTGICATTSSTRIKKHSFPNRVNPDCATQPKPNLAFDFETLDISGIPIAEGLLGSVTVTCERIDECSMTNTLAVSAPMSPVPVSTDITFSDLFTLELGRINVELEAEFGTLTLQFSGDGSFSGFSFRATTVLQDEPVPTELNVFASGAPGRGLNAATVSLRSDVDPLSFSVIASFTGTDTAVAEFSTLAFSARGSLGPIDIEARTAHDLSGLKEASVQAEMGF